MKKILIGLVMFGLMVSAAVADEADTWKSFVNDTGAGTEIIDADDVNPMFLHFTGNLHPRETSGARSTREVFTLGSSSYPWRKVVVSTGDATAPSFTFKGDLDTGVYRVAANTGGLSANGKTIETWGETEVRVGFNGKDKLTIGSAGNGYGYIQGYYSTTPLSALNLGLNNYLDSTGNTTQEIVARYAPLLQLVGRGSNSTFDFSVFPPYQTSATLLMSLNSDGNLYWGSTQKGIAQNTSDGADTSILYFSGGGAPAQTRGGYIAIAGNDNTDDGGSVAIVPGANSATGEVKIYNRSGTKSLVVNTSGYVGIGGTNPSSATVPLRVQGAGGDLDLDVADAFRVTAYIQNTSGHADGGQALVLNVPQVAGALAQPITSFYAANALKFYFLAGGDAYADASWNTFCDAPFNRDVLADIKKIRGDKTKDKGQGLIGFDKATLPDYVKGAEMDWQVGRTSAEVEREITTAKGETVKTKSIEYRAIKERRVPVSIDKVAFMNTIAIQRLIEKIEALEARVKELESKK